MLKVYEKALVLGSSAHLASVSWAEPVLMSEHFHAKWYP